VHAGAGQLHLERRPEAAVAHLHRPRIGIGGACARIFGPVPVAPLGRLHLRQLLQCRTDALFALLGRPLARGLGLAAGCSRVGRGALLDVAHEFASFGKVLLQAGFAPERRRASIGAHPHAVLRHALQADRARTGQRRHVGRQHLVHQRLVARAKVVERVVVHRHPAADPAIRVVLAHQPGNLPPAAYAFQRRVQPQREQDARVDRRAPSVATPRLDRLKQPAQVLLLDVAPHQPCAVLLAQQRLQVRRPQFDLAAVGPQQARRALPLGRRLRLPRPLGLPLIYPRQVLEQTAARFVLVLGFAHVQHQASRMPAAGGRRKTLAPSEGVNEFNTPCVTS